MILIWTNIIDFDIECIWMPKGCAYIASTESTECPEPRNKGGMIGYPIREIWSELFYICSTGVIPCWNEQLERPYFNTIHAQESIWNIYKSKAERLKGDLYIGQCHSSIGNTWVPVKIICISDYCKTKACSIGVIPSMGLLLFCADVTNCWFLGTYLYKEWILRWGKWSMYCKG